MKKILIVGPAGHGKDTVAELLVDSLSPLIKLKFKSSSMIAAEHVIYPVLKDEYASVEDCFNDRRNRRKEWYELIKEFNSDAPTRLAELCFLESDIYVGVRDYHEHLAICEKFKPIMIWVDASSRVPMDHADPLNFILHIPPDTVEITRRFNFFNQHYSITAPLKKAIKANMAPSLYDKPIYQPYKIIVVHVKNEGSLKELKEKIDKLTLGLVLEDPGNFYV